MIETNLIYAKTKSGFQTKLDASEVKNTSIAFIEDSNEIWTNGHYWPCPYSKEEIDNLISSCTTTEELTSTLADYLTKSNAADTYQVKGDYALATDIPTSVSELTNDSGYLTSIPNTYLQTTSVVDNLTSTSTNTPLSANQGKVLNDKLENLKNNLGFEGTNYNLPDLSSTHYLSGCQTIIECLLALDTKLNELEQQLTIKQP